MDGFLSLIERLVQANGLEKASIHREQKMLALPGYFRPTKLWDLLVVHKGELILAIELKSQVGSFGNNFNNRTEEALGTAQDFWTAYREGALGKQPRPFVGWLMLVEDAEQSRKAVKAKSPHFSIRPEFKNASYLTRYDLLCQKLVQESLYSSTALLTSKRSALETGEFQEMSKMTDLRGFVSALAGHVAAAAARLDE
jgi:type II restriction enzyme